MANFCTNCGAPNNEGTKFCTSCGSPIVQAAPIEQPIQEPVQEPVQQPVYQQTVQQPVYQQPVQEPVYAQQPVQQGYQQQSYPQQPLYQQPQGSYQPGYTAFTENSRKSKSGLIAVIAIILVLGLAAVALFVWPGFLSGGSGGLNGTWTSGGDSRIVIDGSKLTGADGQDYKLEVSGNSFKVIGDSEDDVEEYLYKLDGDKLMLYNTEDTTLEYPIVTLTRQGSGGNNNNDDNGGNFGSQEELLEGRWEDEYGLSSYEFDDGDCEIGALGMTFEGTYEVSGNSLTITYEVLGYETTLEYTFEVNGDTLTMTDTDGNSADYIRK